MSGKFVKVWVPWCEQINTAMVYAKPVTIDGRPAYEEWPGGRFYRIGENAFWTEAEAKVKAEELRLEKISQMRRSPLLRRLPAMQRHLAELERLRFE